ncbi:thrombospondin type-1 domain-containing protein 7A isoform X2 [Octopus sinensis]|uniref:Thrombospondin type-1 domain-containing protein 7A isoform X2 n=1 Tax=Octopus sinensis TaxID=2607531 RepID=A0A7E6FFH5_9MOLL|nr:thrombospondin type-1 domain-containing protein 7A isoform X2 [Octopus sinensis]
MSMEDGKYRRRRKVDTTRRLLLILMCCYSTMGQQVYRWKTGEWGPCEHRWCGENGTKTRTLKCVGVYGETVDIARCDNVHRPATQENCYKPCNHHRSNFNWEIGTWGKCKPFLPTLACKRQVGLQTRPVKCFSVKDKKVRDDDVCSYFLRKPNTERECQVYCPQDCIVSEFSNWSSCDSCTYINKTRTRTVVVPPFAGGKPCPVLSEMRPCPKCIDSFTFKIGPWRKCKEIHTKNSVHKQRFHHYIGYQERDISCLGRHGRLVPLKDCWETGIVHADYQSCVLPQDCIVSEWMGWKAYSDGCQTIDGVIYKSHVIRKRKILQMPLGDGAKCPNLEEIQENNTAIRRLKRCPIYHWIVSGFGLCKPSSVTTNCGPGLQQRTVICVEETDDNKQVPVAESNCKESKPSLSKVCHIECRARCLASEWSAWSKCKSISCIGDQLHRKKRQPYSGYRERTLKSISTPNGGNAKCPTVTETQPCDPGPCYSWNLTSSNICSLDSSERLCGQGTRHNKLLCTDVHGVQKDESLCDSYSRPSDKESCRIPCPMDCVLSEWSSWTECPDECDKKARATNRDRRRMVLAFPVASGPACPPFSSLKESSPCPSRLECRTFSWVAMAWKLCILGQSVTCGTGQQRREVKCKSEGRDVDDSWCVRNLKPNEVQTCQLPCPRDCEVTDYSHWSPCSATCQEARQATPTQSRKKYILQPADEGGKPCPMKLVDTKHCTDLPWCDEYLWEVTPWSACVLPPRVPYCGQGLRGRNVTCKDQRNSSYPPDVCLERVGPMPIVAEQCFVPCDENCFLTEWTKFGPCINGCNGYTIRIRELTSKSKYNSECKNRERYPRYQRRHCQCDPFQPVVIGNQSDCIIEEPVRTTPVDKVDTSQLFSPFSPQGPEMQSTTDEESLQQSDCGEGKAYKALLCLNSNNILKGTSQCSHAGPQNPCCTFQYKFESCSISCPVDCLMSQWSSWSTCNASCGYGFRERYRTVEQSPLYGGRPCPKLGSKDTESFRAEIQTKLCKTDCKEYVWRHDGWDSCVYQSPATCGRGIQTRRVMCVEKEDLSRSISLQDSYCDEIPKPAEQRICSTPCIRECVVSEWSEWTKCDVPCNRQQTQWRTRKVLREPDKYRRDHYPCPSLREELYCIKGKNCREFIWNVSKWTSCMVKDGEEPCGFGKRERFIMCTDYYGKLQRSHYCYEVAGKPKFKLQEFCEIPCDENCLLSTWSSWGPCSKSCGLGTSQRQRYVLKKAVGYGRPCSSQLTQRKPCVLRGCFRWDVTNWTECFTEKGVCGHGVQIRNITCTGEGKTQVDDSFCKANRSIAAIKTKRSCYIGCPGECVLTEWSEWSACYLNCRDKGVADHERGIQSRSRAILAYPAARSTLCPTKLYESRPCHAKNCFTFRWKYSKWDKEKRHVWCERSDSLNVTGACDETTYPGDTLNCDPPCPGNDSKCSDVNVCQCLTSYEPIYRDNILIGCGPPTVTNTQTKITTKENNPNNSYKRGSMSIWMYAVIGGGTLAVAGLTYFFYAICGLFRKGPRDRDSRSHGQDTTSQHLSIDEQAVQCNHVQAFVEAQQENNENTAVEHKTCTASSPNLQRDNNIHGNKYV